MTMSHSALPVRADLTGDTPTEVASEVRLTFDDRHWRIRGLETQLSCDRLRVNLLVAYRDLTHVETLDLYVACRRRAFLREAADELYVDQALLKRDLGHVLRELEQRQELLIQRTLQPREVEVPLLTDAQRHEALELLQDPRLIERILEDYEARGLVGEENNKLICYLAGVSRLLERPLAVLIQSSSAAGKTSLLEATLALMPPESQVRMSSLTGQALYYMGTRELQHKILSVAEEAGVAEAAYALKLLQSDGQLRIATVGKDSGSGRPQTQHYEVEGPVAMLLTTTAQHPDEELANRCLTLSVCEQPEQTATIHGSQRAAYLPARDAAGESEPQDSISQRHQNAQRLLEPLPVVIPYADQLTFRTDQVRYRRDHAKYLSLIAAVALLHQYQRERITQRGHGREQRSVVATLDDLEWANRLATAVLGEPVDSLLPATRQVWIEWTRLVTQSAQERGLDAGDVRCTQRELREALQKSDRVLRRHLTWLVELEYVLMHRTGRGNQRVYQLACLGREAMPATSPLGLVDVSSLRAQRSISPEPVAPPSQV